MRTIKVKDLPADSMRPPVFLYCPECGEHYSATAGDYFMAPLETVLRCANHEAGERPPLQLCREERRIVPVRP